MGVWGTGLFSDDVACDIRDHYRQLLEDGAEDGDATRLTLEEFEPYRADRLRCDAVEAWSTGT